MNILVADDYTDLSRRAAAFVLESVAAEDAPLVVLPTGNTPVGMYGVLVEAVAAGKADLSHVRPVVLDEYVGLAAGDRRSLYGWLRREFLDPVGLADDRVLRFDPAAVDIDAEAQRVDRAMTAAGPIALQVLGLGLNGHIGFNEPGSSFESRARVVDLTPESIRTNAVYWGEESDVPRRAWTLGLGTLAGARRTLLLVSGRSKAAILAAALTDPVTPRVPATFLRRLEGVTILADRAALAGMEWGAPRSGA